jgi:tetratricopeptide (TPR) repeat protein
MKKITPARFAATLLATLLCPVALADTAPLMASMSPSAVPPASVLPAASVSPTTAAGTATPAAALPEPAVVAEPAAVATPEQPAKTLIPLYTTAQPKAAGKGARAKKAAPAPAPVVAQAAPEASSQLDVTDIDRRLNALLKVAGHYPPNIPGRRDRYMAEQDASELVKALDPYAVIPNASAEVLLRAVKANQVARNLDTGMDAALKAGVYMRRLIALMPAHPEVNYWYGTMLAEGGGMKEGIPYLNKAIKSGYAEAYLPLAQAYLSLEKKQDALKTLQSYRATQKDDPSQAESLIAKVESGGSSIW